MPLRKKDVHEAVRKADRPLSAVEIAALTGCSYVTVRRHLKELVLSGKVLKTLSKPAGSGHPPYLYEAGNPEVWRGP